MSYYHIDDNFSKAWSVDGNLDWLIINYFYEPIDHDKDWVIAVSLQIRQN